MTLPMRPAPPGSPVSASDPRFGRWQMTGANASPLTLGLAAALVCYGLTQAIGLHLSLRYKP